MLHNLHFSRWGKVVTTIIVVLLFVIGALTYLYFKITGENKTLIATIAELNEALRNKTDSLNSVEAERDGFRNAFLTERQKTTEYSNKIDSISNTVESLERLAKIDPELLQKYSKVYFLNENYTPSELTNIDTKYLYDKSRPFQIHDRVLPFLSKMLDAANADGVKISVISAYRSFGTQAALKSSYKVTYGAGTANQFSADQGYSEHQLGTTLDLTTPKVAATFNGFDKTDAFTWLTNNAYKYGFVLSYPKNNGYYTYEPWHWRFVGLDLALRLHNENKHFYDLDQRDISAYLGHLFNGTTTSAQAQ